MAAGMPVPVMPIAMGVLMAMSGSLVAVLMPVMTMRRGVVRVLMLMLVLVMAAHESSLLSVGYHDFNHLAGFLSSLAPMGSIARWA